MAIEDLIETKVFCNYFEVDDAFITSLEETGLVELTIVNQRKFIPHSKLNQLERIVRLHRELEINVAGIEALINVLQRVEQLQQENINLKNKLRLFATDEA